MAEEQQAQAETRAGKGPKKKASGVRTIMLVGVFVVLQTAIVLVVLWALKSATDTGPQRAEARQAGDETPQLVSVPALPGDPDNKIVAVNAQRGELVYWSLKVTLRVPKGQEEGLRASLIANEDLVREKINTVIRGSDPMILKREADHATLKRQIRAALNSVLGKGAIGEVVIPQCIPERAN